MVDLFIPTSPIDLSATPIDRHLRVLASDLAISVETLQDAADDLRAKVEVGDARIENLGTNGRQERQILLGRTVPGSLVSSTVSQRFAAVIFKLTELFTQCADRNDKASRFEGQLRHFSRSSD